VKTTCLTIRKCPQPVRDALKERAKLKGRSLNAEAIEVLASAVSERVSEAELLRRIRSSKMSAGLTLKETRDAIRAGRQ
jgi:plasmid stability protein